MCLRSFEEGSREEAAEGVDEHGQEVEGEDEGGAGEEEVPAGEGGGEATHQGLHGVDPHLGRFVNEVGGEGRAGGVVDEALPEMQGGENQEQADG